MLKVSDVVPFNGICAAPNNLVIVGGEATVKLALAVLPVPPFVEVTLPVVLVYRPEAAPVTVTLNWHWLFTAIVAPVSAMPVGLVVVNVPPQTVADALATVSPVGNVSVNATPVKATVLAAGLVMVKVNDVVAFSAMVFGLKTLAIEGGATTVRTAVLLVVPVPPSVEVIAPVVLLLKAMNASPPIPATVSKFSRLPYAASADTSPMVKSLAVSLTSGANCGESAASLSRIRTAVMMFVFTPEQICTLTQVQRLRVTPYL